MKGVSLSDLNGINFEIISINIYYNIFHINYWVKNTHKDTSQKIHYSFYFLLKVFLSICS